MVEFEDVDGSTAAEENLHGKDIYPGCCTIKVMIVRMIVRIRMIVRMRLIVRMKMINDSSKNDQ